MKNFNHTPSDFSDGALQELYKAIERLTAFESELKSRCETTLSALNSDNVVFKDLMLDKFSKTVESMQKLIADNKTQYESMIKLYEETQNKKHSDLSNMYSQIRDDAEKVINDYIKRATREIDVYIKNSRSLYSSLESKMTELYKSLSKMAENKVVILKDTNTLKDYSITVIEGKLYWGENYVENT